MPLIFLQEVKKLANAMNEESLNSGDVLEIFLPAHDSCMWLNQDVVIMDRYAYLFLIFKYSNLHILLLSRKCGNLILLHQVWCA